MAAPIVVNGGVVEALRQRSVGSLCSAFLVKQR